MPGLSKEHVPRPCSREHPVNMAQQRPPKVINSKTGSVSDRHYLAITLVLISSAWLAFESRKVGGQVGRSPDGRDKRQIRSGSFGIREWDSCRIGGDINAPIDIIMSELFGFGF